MEMLPDKSSFLHLAHLRQEDPLNTSYSDAAVHKFLQNSWSETKSSKVKKRLF